MKRYFTIFAMIVALSLVCESAFSQKIELKTVGKGEMVAGLKKVKPQKPQKEKKPKTEFSREKGVYLRPELEGGVYLGNRNGYTYLPGIGGAFSLNIGYQVAPAFAVGIGVGYQIAAPGNMRYPYYLSNHDSDVRYKTQSSSPLQALPVYANIRFYMSNTKCQPFFDLKVGGIIGLKSSLVSIDRNFATVGNEYYDATNEWYGIWDTWHQYDETAKMQGFYGTLTFGFTVRNFGIGLEASLMQWSYESEKSLHKEFRPNGIPEWEYEQTVSKMNETTHELSSGVYRKIRGMVALKLEYTIPFKKKSKY